MVEEEARLWNRSQSPMIRQKQWALLEVVRNGYMTTGACDPPVVCLKILLLLLCLLDISFSQSVLERSLEFLRRHVANVEASWTFARHMSR